MATRTAFLVRSLRILPILLSVICLLAPAEAQHGGRGGHSGGGHFGGGHSSGRHSGGGHAGHFGWLHFWSGKHPPRHAGFGASSTSDPLATIVGGCAPSKTNASLSACSHTRG